jgi:hypothetical protein
MENNGHIPENLKRAGKEHPFRVPENYFENFAGRLQDRLSQEQNIPAAGRMIRFLRPQLGLAAMIAGVLLLTWFGYRQFVYENQDGVIQESVIDNYELSSIVDYYLHDYDEELLITTIVETGAETGMVTLEGYSDEIMDFLTVDGIDYSLLIDDN